MNDFNKLVKKEAKEFNGKEVIGTHISNYKDLDYNTQELYSNKIHKNFSPIFKQGKIENRFYNEEFNRELKNAYKNFDICKVKYLYEDRIIEYVFNKNKNENNGLVTVSVYISCDRESKRKYKTDKSVDDREDENYVYTPVVHVNIYIYDEELDKYFVQEIISFL